MDTTETHGEQYVDEHVDLQDATGDPIDLGDAPEATNQDTITFDNNNIMDPEPIATQEPPLIKQEPRHSTRTRVQTKHYVPSMAGTKYGYAAMQLAK